MDKLNEMNDRAVGLVHDYLLVLRGAERTFAAIADIWPDAPVYTTLYDPLSTDGRFAGHPVTTSILQRARLRQGGFRSLLPLLPLAASRLPVASHPVLISSSSAFAHGVHPGPGSVHVCYCHTPFRYAWVEPRGALSEVTPLARPALAATLAGIRRWDLRASRRVTHYVANSCYTERRIRELYGRRSTVIHPPVDVDRFESGEPEDFFLAVSELVSHKRIEVAAEAASRVGRRLKVVGGGPELTRLRCRYGKWVEFVGRLGDRELKELYRGALAVVVPTVEEFGIVAVEAQAAGKPVIAARGGGATETVIEGATGRFVEPGDVVALARALRHFDAGAYDSATIQRHARQFSIESFQAKMRDAVRQAVAAHG